MDTEKLLELGARGVHLLFGNDEIEAAFERDAAGLRDELAGRAAEVQNAIDMLMAVDDVDRGRAFIEGLDAGIRHVLVLIYFDLLDTHVRRAATLH
jgi:hypothetical protein